MNSHALHRKEENIEFLRRVPKAELHVHLEGCIEPRTLIELARRNNLLHLLPTSLADLESWFQFKDSSDFKQVFNVIRSLLRTSDDFEVVVTEAASDMASQNIFYREFILSPYTHTHYLEKT